MERNLVEDGEEKKRSSNPKTYLIITILLAIAILAALIFLFRKYSKPEEKIDAKLNRSEIYVNEDLVYTDNTKGATNWLWEFGNGDKSDKQQGNYRFKSSGSYVVRLTVNSSLREQFIVQVKDTVAAAVADTTLYIGGPTGGMVFEEIRLEANGPGEVFEWWFGETGRVDIIGKSALYRYSKPGKYRVRMKSDRSPKVVYHELRIEDPNIGIGDVATPGKAASEALNDLKKNIQAIANGADFESRYNYILSKHLCRSEKVKVQVEMDGNKKQMDIYAYLMGLTFSKGISIDEVSIASATNTGSASECPTLLAVKQSK